MGVHTPSSHPVSVRRMIEVILKAHKERDRDRERERERERERGEREERDIGAKPSR